MFYLCSFFRNKQVVFYPLYKHKLPASVFDASLFSFFLPFPADRLAFPDFIKQAPATSRITRKIATAMAGEFRTTAEYPSLLPGTVVCSKVVVSAFFTQKKLLSWQLPSYTAVLFKWGFILGYLQLSRVLELFLKNFPWSL